MQCLVLLQNFVIGLLMFDCQNECSGVKCFNVVTPNLITAVKVFGTDQTPRYRWLREKRLRFMFSPFVLISLRSIYLSRPLISVLLLSLLAFAFTLEGSQGNLVCRVPFTGLSLLSLSEYTFVL